METKIINQNAIIAEFMELPFISDKGQTNYIKDLEHCPDYELSYNSDWNWLMEVVDKIETLCSNLGFQISSKFVHIRVNNNLTISSGVQTNRQKAVYNACVEFINWHNEQKQ